MPLATYTEDPAERRDVLVRARRSAESLMTILNDILDFSKIEAGKVELARVDLEMQAVCDGVMDLMTFEADRKGLELRGWVDPNLPRPLYDDPGRLRQILINLVGNALKFTKEGSVSVRFRSFSSRPERSLLREAPDAAVTLRTGRGGPVDVPLSRRVALAPSRVPDEHAHVLSAYRAEARALVGTAT